MSSTQFGINIDTEKVQREALLVLFDNLNDKIDDLEEEWLARDSDLFDRMERVAPNWTVEHIEPDNFHPGTLTQLMNRPISEFPNVCAIAYDANPLNTDDDQGEVYNIQLGIEVMVKSELNEQEVNSRIKKTLEAIQAVYLDGLENRTLNHTIIGMGRPRETTGDVFTVVEPLQGNKKWFWQGGSLTYPVSKYVSLY